MTETSAVTLLSKKSKKGSVDLDQILDVAHEFENLTKEKAEEIAYELTDNEGQGEFKLGGVFSVIKVNGWWEGQGYKDFDTYVSEKYGIEYRKARYCINIYDKLVELQVPWSKVSHIGWSKLVLILPVLDLENLDEWIEKAATNSWKDLGVLVKAAKGGESEKSTVTDAITKMSFALHEDQAPVVKEALQKVKELTNTNVDTVALTTLCEGYLGGNVSVSATSLKDQMASVGYKAVLELFGEIWPQIDLEVNIPADMA